jgi:tRNA threonylcarbamoyladenosine biosynthesis protein TsaE
MFDFAKEFQINNEKESRAFARKLAANILPGNVIAFSGDLGVGKSFFCREIIKFLCGEDTKVISPTFNLLQTYEATDFSIYHYDLYRLEYASEIYELGIEEALSDNVILMEWPEIAAPLLPNDTIYIQIEAIDDKKRLVSFNRAQRKSR